jgi:hypothetical protein
MNSAAPAPAPVPALQPWRLLAIVNGPLYALLVGFATLCGVSVVADVVGRETGMEVLILALVAAGVAALVGTVVGVAIAACERTPDGLARAVRRLWRIQLAAAPVVVGLMFLWQLAVNPVVC